MISEICYELIANILMAGVIYFFAKLKLFKGFCEVRIVTGFLKHKQHDKKQKSPDNLSQSVNLRIPKHFFSINESTASHYHNNFCPFTTSQFKWSCLEFSVPNKAKFNFSSKVAAFDDNNRNENHENT